MKTRSSTRVAAVFAALALMAAVTACSIKLSEPASRRCDESHACGTGKTCELAAGLCVPLANGTDGGARDGGSGDGGSLDGGPLAVRIYPPSELVRTSGSLRFEASSDDGSDSYTWSVQEGATGGTVDGDGKYLAPSVAGGPFHVIAQSVKHPTLTAQAPVTVRDFGTALKGLVLHFAADNINGVAEPYPSDGAPVAVWRDMMAFQDLTQTVESQKPIYVRDALGGLPAVTFDGLQQALATETFGAVIPQPTTVIIVFLDPTPLADGGGQTIFDGTNTATERQRLAALATPPGGLQLIAGTFGPVNKSHVTNAFHVATLQFQGNASVIRVDTNFDIHLDGGTITPGDAGMGGLIFGSRHAPEQYAHTQIAEAWVFNRALTFTEYSLIEQAMLDKYGF